MISHYFSEVNKATACIDAIEEVEKLQQRHLLESLMNTITFSKLLVAAQQGDLDKSETAVKQLLRNTHTPFNTAMAAVKKLQLLMKEGDRDRMSEYYKQLAGKYSRYIYFLFLGFSLHLISKYSFNVQRSRVYVYSNSIFASYSG